MKRISAIAIALLLMIGLTAEDQANAGVSKCLAISGDVGANSIFPLVMLYNPNPSGTIDLTRLRIFNGSGVLVGDLTFPPGTLTVPGRGSQFFNIGTFGTDQGLTVITNWDQKAHPLGLTARLNILIIDGSSNALSISQSNCP